MTQRIEIPIEDLPDDVLEKLISDNLMLDGEELDFDEDDDIEVDLPEFVYAHGYPKSVQCGNQSCGRVFPAKVMSMDESDYQRKWRQAEEEADKLLGESCQD